LFYAKTNGSGPTPQNINASRDSTAITNHLTRALLVNKISSIDRKGDGWTLKHTDGSAEIHTEKFFERLKLRGLSKNTHLAYGYDFVNFFCGLGNEYDNWKESSGQILRRIFPVGHTSRH
jgi:hypothetical protein